MLSFDSQTFSWLGRRLMSYAKGGTTTNYTYNSDGIRTKKVSGSATTEYCLNGTQVLAEKRGGTLINYLYASDGTRVGFKTGGKVYYYVYNLQGDVTHIVDESRNIAATYRYDPFGKILNLSSLTNIGKLNPFRYRGYYYDTESNLYYLNSRYYNPEIGRFINADNCEVVTATPTAISDKNLYSYCDNNPVARADDGGSFWHIIVGAAIGAGLSAISKVVSNAIDGKKLTDGLLTSLAFGAIGGAIGSTGIGVVGSVIANAGLSMAEETADQIIEHSGFNNFDVGSVVESGVMGAVSGAIGGGGDGTKSLMNLGKQTVKRPVRAIRHSGVRQGIREGRKAFSYYAKSTKKYYAKKVGFSSRKDLFISSISTLLSKGIDCFRHRR